MVYDGIADNTASLVRSHLRQLLKTWGEEAISIGREVALDTICNGLETIPVPIVGKALASAVRKRFQQQEPDDLDSSVAYAIELLERMQESDDDLDYGLQSLGLSMESLQRDMDEIKGHLLQRDIPSLRVLAPSVEENWPVADNRISMLLSNGGGGSVVVEEIFLDVEHWEAETRVDFTVPAAPLNIVYLMAELSTGCASYPLLQLNGESQRLFNERGAGAERFIIDLNSPENATYHLRLRMPFVDLATGGRDVLVYPPLTSAPIVLCFRCAPGWMDVDPARLIEPAAVLEHMTSMFKGMAKLVQDVASLPKGDSERFLARDRWAVEHGIFEYVFHSPSFNGMLSRLVPFASQLAIQESNDRTCFHRWSPSAAF